MYELYLSYLPDGVFRPTGANVGFVSGLSDLV